MKMTEQDYKEYVLFGATNPGYCSVCDDITDDCTEPDAEGYECPECENNTVKGAEDAFLEGYIEIE